MTFTCRFLSTDELNDSSVWNDMQALTPYGILSDGVFVRNWWRYFSEGRTLAAAQVYDGKRLVAFLPMFVSDHPYFRRYLEVRELRFFMDEFITSVPKAPFLYDAEYSGRMDALFAAAIDAAIKNRKWGIQRVHLGPLAEAPSLPNLCSHEVEMVIPLAERRGDIFSGMSYDTSCNLKRRLRSMDRKFPNQWSMELARPDDAIISQFVEMKRSNWNGPTRCAFEDSRLTNFIRASFLEASNTQCLMITVQGEIAGMDLLVSGDDEVFSYNTCYADKYRILGIGRMLTFKIMEEYLQSKSTFSLGLGDQKYKLDWGVKTFNRYRISIWNAPIKRLAFGAMAFAKERIKAKTDNTSE